MEETRATRHATIWHRRGGAPFLLASPPYKRLGGVRCRSHFVAPLATALSSSDVLLKVYTNGLCISYEASRRI